MNSYTIFGVIVGTIVAIPIIVVAIQARSVTFHVAQEFRSLAEHNNVDMDYSEIWNTTGIGLDLCKRQVLILNLQTPAKTLLNLHDLDACSVQRESNQVYFLFTSKKPAGNTKTLLFQPDLFSPRLQNKYLGRIQFWQGMLQKAIEGKKYPL